MSREQVQQLSVAETLREAIRLCRINCGVIVVWLAVVTGGLVLCVALGVGLLYLALPFPYAAVFTGFAWFFLPPILLILASVALADAFAADTRIGVSKLASGMRHALRRLPVVIGVSFSLLLGFSLTTFLVVTMLLLPYLASRMLVLPAVVALDDNRSQPIVRSWCLTRSHQRECLLLFLALCAPILVLLVITAVIGTVLLWIDVVEGFDLWLVSLPFLVALLTFHVWLPPLVATQNVVYQAVTAAEQP